MYQTNGLLIPFSEETDAITEEKILGKGQPPIDPDISANFPLVEEGKI